MIPILSIKDFEDKILEIKYQGVVGLMLAPYNQTKVKAIVDQYYNAWHYTSGDAFNLYWIGYGNSPSEPQQRLLDIGDVNFKKPYFDIEMFCKETNSLNERVYFKYINHFELILFNCYRGKINYNDHLRIKLDALYSEKNCEQSPDLIESIIENVKEKRTIDDLKKFVKKKMLVSRLVSVNVNDILNFLAMLNPLCK